MLNSTNDDAKILAFLNGINADLTYTGNAYNDLGTTTLGAADAYFRGVAFLFESGVGNIVFGSGGTSTFAEGQSRGFAPLTLVPVPVPPAVALGALALGGLAVYGRRQRRTARG
jgi:hypothetical protein